MQVITASAAMANFSSCAFVEQHERKKNPHALLSGVSLHHQLPPACHQVVQHGLCRSDTTILFPSHGKSKLLILVSDYWPVATNPWRASGLCSINLCCHRPGWFPTAHLFHQRAIETAPAPACACRAHQWYQ